MGPADFFWLPKSRRLSWSTRDSVDLLACIAVVDVVPVAPALHGDVRRGRGLVARARVDLEETLGQLARIDGLPSCVGTSARTTSRGHVLARHLDAVGQVEVDLRR